VRPERFELPTYCSGGNRSIHLSYGRTTTVPVYMDALKSINVGLCQCRVFGAKKPERKAAK
jgi:hypothetical protein